MKLGFGFSIEWGPLAGGGRGGSTGNFQSAGKTRAELLIPRRNPQQRAGMIPIPGIVWRSDRLREAPRWPRSGLGTSQTGSSGPAALGHSRRGSGASQGTASASPFSFHLKYPPHWKQIPKWWQNSWKTGAQSTVRLRTGVIPESQGSRSRRSGMSRAGWTDLGRLSRNPRVLDRACW